VKLTLKQTNLAQQLCVELPALRNRLGEAGLWETYHAMDAAVKKIGYELAEKAYWNHAKANSSEGRAD
jgi:transposase